MFKKKLSKFTRLLLSILLIIGMISQNVSYVYSEELQNGSNTAITTNEQSSQESGKTLPSVEDKTSKPTNDTVVDDKSNSVPKVNNDTITNNDKTLEKNREKNNTPKEDIKDSSKEDLSKTTKKSKTLPQKRSVKISKFTFTTVENSTPKDGKYDLGVTYKLNVYWDASIHKNQLINGDYFEVSLPKELKYLANSNVVIKDNFSTAQLVVGNNSKVVIKLNSNVVNATGVNGHFEVFVNVNNDIVKPGSQISLNVGGITKSYNINKIDQKEVVAEKKSENEVVNKNGGKIQINTFETGSNTSVSNVGFKIINKQNYSSLNLTTNSFGTLVADKLSDGKYIVEATNIPSSYSLNNTTFEMEVSSNAKSIKNVYLEEKTKEIKLSHLIDKNSAKIGTYYKLQASTVSAKEPVDLPLSMTTGVFYEGKDISFGELPIYDNQGQTYIYSVREATKEEIDEENDILGLDSFNVEPKFLARSLMANNGVVSDNLKDFLKSVTIQGVTEVEGVNPVSEYNTYDVTFNFAESPGSVQFNDDAEMTYDIPPGIVIQEGSQGVFPITITDSEGSSVVSANKYGVVGGKLKVQFNAADPNFNRLKSFANVAFNVTFKSKFTKNTKTIVFADGVEKKFEFINVADLNVTKKHTYDPTTSTVKYMVVVKSTGENNDVEVKDTITGTALVFKKDVAVKKKVNGIESPADLTIDYESVSNGFKVNIPKMGHEEELIFEYSAKIDFTKISGKGTVEETKNTVTTKSNEVPTGKTVNDNVVGEIINFLTKSGVQEEIEKNKKYKATWTIIVNPNKEMDVSNRVIFDNIRNKEVSYFTGSGINVDRNGVKTLVPWNQLIDVVRDANNNVVSWKYRFPNDAGTDKFIITADTITDTSSQFSGYTLNNDVSIDKISTGGTVKFNNVGDSVVPKKEVLSENHKVTEWKITVPVKAAGLPSLTVVDDTPKLARPGEAVLFDLPIRESLRIEGLTGSESYKIDWRESSTHYKGFVIDFYKNSEKTQTGLLSTNSDRVISIILKTEVNQEWLELAAKNGYNSFSTHTNSMSARIGSQSFPASASTSPKKQSFEKKYISTSSANINGVVYPVFEYELTLTNPLGNVATINDEFDTTILKYYDAKPISITAGNTLSESQVGGSVTAQDTAKGMDIKITDFAKTASGKKYVYYKVRYSLIVKDKDALNKLDNLVGENSDYNIENKATWGELSGESKTEVTQYSPGLDKILVQKPNENNGYIAKFKLTINPLSRDLNPDGDELVVFDTLSSNLRLIDGTVATEPKTEISYSYDKDSNKLTFSKIPDGIKLDIIYEARVLGKESDGQVKFSNSLVYGKYKKIVEDFVIITSSGAGSGSNPSITLRKANEENNSVSLAGAIFQLFVVESGNEVPVKDKDDKDVTFTTGSNGSVLVEGNQNLYGWVLVEGKQYRLKEIKEPVGYIKGSQVDFILRATPQNQFEFNIRGESILATNKPIKRSISVSKTWSSNKKSTSVTVNLMNGDKVVSSVELNENNGWKHTFENLDKYDAIPKLDGSGKPIPIDYKVVEVGPEVILDVNNPGNGIYSPTITKSDGDTTDSENAKNVVFTILNDYISPKRNIVVTKTWENVNGEKPEVWFKLMRGVLPGKLEDVPDSLKKLEAGKDTVEWTGLDVTNKNGEPYTYIVKETDASGNERAPGGFEKTGDEDANKKDFFNGETSDLSKLKVTEAVDKLEFAIKNTLAKIEIPVTKTWVGGPTAETITVHLYKKVNGEKQTPAYKTLELKKSEGWSGKFTDVDKLDADNNPIEYDLEEEPIDNYVAIITGDAKSGFNISNKFESPKINIPIEKLWIGKPTERVVFHLQIDNQDAPGVESLVLSADQEWKGEFKDLDALDNNGQKINYSIREEKLENILTDISRVDESDITKGFKVKNINDERISIPVKKVWVGKESTEVKILLESDYDKNEPQELKLNAENSWSGEFKDLKKYNPETGAEIKYSIKEETLDGYLTSISRVDENDITKGFEVKNINDERISIPVKKVWVGKESTEVKILLESDYDKNEPQELKLNAENSWSGEFKDLKKYNPETGAEIKYSIKEEVLDGYVTSISRNDDSDVSKGFVVKNTKTVYPLEPTKVNVNVDKKWIGARIDSVTVFLKADGVEVPNSRVELNESNNWHHTYAQLKAVNNITDTKKIVYTVEEVKLPNYITKIENKVVNGTKLNYSFEITNTNDERINIPVKKVWVGKELKEVKIILLSDYKKNGQQSLELNAANSWKGEFKNLKKYNPETGKLIKYSVKEVKVNGYNTVITGDQSKGFVVTNKEIPNIPNKPRKPKLPQTGDSSSDIYIFTSVLLLGLGILFIRRSKSN